MIIQGIKFIGIKRNKEQPVELSYGRNIDIESRDIRTIGENKIEIDNNN